MHDRSPHPRTPGVLLGVTDRGALLASGAGPLRPRLPRLVASRLAACLADDPTFAAAVSLRLPVARLETAADLLASHGATNSAAAGTDRPASGHPRRMPRTIRADAERFRGNPRATSRAKRSDNRGGPWGPPSTQGGNDVHR
jgi:hypothetical protein